LRLLPATSLVPANRVFDKPLSNLRPDQVTRVSVGGESDEEDSVDIEMMIPTEGGTLVEYEETILLDEEVPHYLTEAAQAFWNAATRAVRERVVEKTRTCDACLGNCCWEFDSVMVTHQDIVRMREGGVDVSKYVEMFTDELGREVPNLRGQIGMLKKVELQHPIDGRTVDACPAFDGTKCTIYEFRPMVCSDFPMVGCSEFEPKS